MNSLREIEQRLWGTAPRSQRVQAPVHPIRYRVSPLPTPIHHESAATAWAAAISLLVAWKRREPANVGHVLSRLEGPGRGILDEGRGLTEKEATDLLVVSGVSRRTLRHPGNPGEWHELLRQYGPLWALFPERPSDRASFRGMLVVGIAGDGSASRTRLFVFDPESGRRRRTTVERFAHRLTQGGCRASILHLPQGARRDLLPSKGHDVAPSHDPAEPVSGDTRAKALDHFVRAFEQPRLSSAGLEFIARHESFRGDLYNDAGGHCTIGYGHLVHLGPCNGTEPEPLRRGISEATARELLGQDTRSAEATVRSSVTPTLTQAETDALVSVVFNIGTGAFRKSTLLRELNAGHRDRIPAELRRWVYSGGRVVEGLRNRREDEIRLFTGGDYGAGSRAQTWVCSASMPEAVVGSVETVLDGDARLRGGPPDFAVTGKKLPQYGRVSIRAASSDGSHVQVADSAGVLLGWTVRGNLGAFFKDDNNLAAVELAPSAPIAIDASWSQQKKGLAELYNRLGGLFTALARATNTPVPAALAVWWVESGGRQHTVGHAIIRFENHLLFRSWGQQHVSSYDQHFQHGGHAGISGDAWQQHSYRRSASDGWTTFHGNQTAEYDVLDLATDLASESTALQCISIGGPQILVSNYRTLGYDTPRAMYDAFQADERWHVLGFYDYCQYHGGHLARRRYLLDHLRAQRWVDFARGYNGNGKAQEYGNHIQAAFNVASQLPIS